MASLDVSQQEPDNGRRVEMADGQKPANANEDTTEEEREPVKTLTQRMAAIRADASGVGKEKIDMKTKSGSEYSIKAHTIEGVLHGVRALLDDHGVWMLPCLDRYEFHGNRCDAVYRFDFQNMDDLEDRMSITWAGSGTDNSDKALAKAGTNALKEMLKKVFLITDREDAKEEEDRTEFRTDEGATRAEVDEAKDQAKAALHQWANNHKAALETVETIPMLKRLKRENSDQLDEIKDISPAMHNFFTELYERREKELKEAPNERQS